jgi:hypothetical protein
VSVIVSSCEELGVLLQPMRVVDIANAMKAREFRSSFIIDVFKVVFITNVEKNSLFLKGITQLFLQISFLFAEKKEVTGQLAAKWVSVTSLIFMVITYFALFSKIAS